jgi:hypothetical protein
MRTRRRATIEDLRQAIDCLPRRTRMAMLEGIAARRRTAADRPGEPDRTPELSPRPGWAWTRVVRRYDEYATIIRRVKDARGDAEPRADSEPAERALAG